MGASGRERFNAVISKVSDRQDAASAGAAALVSPALEKKFLRVVEECDDFQMSLGMLDKVYHVPLGDLQNFSRGLVRICWTQAVEVLGGDGPLASAKAEIKRLRKRVADCNMSALRQVAMAQSSRQDGGAPADCAEDRNDPDLITFHEPLQYLEEDQRLLVLRIVKEKLRLIQEGKAPPGLLDALENPVVFSPDKAKAEIERLMEELKDSQQFSEELQEELEAAQQKLEVHREQLARLGSVKKSLDAAEARARELDGSLKEAQRQLDEEKDTHSQAQQELSSLRTQMEAVTSEAEEARQIRDRLEERFTELQATQVAANAEREAALAAAAAEASRRPEQRTQGAQTELSGPVVAPDVKKIKELQRNLAQATAARDEQAEECRKLRLALDELQRKLREEFMEGCHGSGIHSQVESLFNDIGLGELVRGLSVFERLYKDAERRVQQLAELQKRRHVEFEENEATFIERLQESEVARSVLPQIIVQQLATPEHSRAVAQRQSVLDSLQVADESYSSAASRTESVSPTPRQKMERKSMGHLMVLPIMPQLVRAVEAGSRPSRSLSLRKSMGGLDVEVAPPPKAALQPASPPRTNGLPARPVVQRLPAPAAPAKPEADRLYTKLPSLLQGVQPQTPVTPQCLARRAVALS